MNHAAQILSEVKKAVSGKDGVLAWVLAAILAQGHILLEDVPGVGKTTMALAFSRAMGLDCGRVQFTPDVLPSDITGYCVYNKQTGQFEYKEGAAMCSLFLADEINRTSSKTQSALLEVMEEGAVTVDGVTRVLPRPFIVIATQNPIGSVGTQMLPESQLDRFLMKLSVGYPDIDSEISIMKAKASASAEDSVCAVASRQDIIMLRNAAEEIFADDKIYRYIASLAAATREHPKLKLGLSPRGTLALSAAAKASALLHGRTFVIPDDISYIFEDVSAHRIILTAKAKASGYDTKSVLEDILASVPAPKI